MARGACRLRRGGEEASDDGCLGGVSLLSSSLPSNFQQPYNNLPTTFQMQVLSTEMLPYTEDMLAPYLSCRKAA